jgi:hypothetical protein
MKHIELAKNPINFETNKVDGVSESKIKIGKSRSKPNRLLENGNFYKKLFLNY